MRTGLYSATMAVVLAAGMSAGFAATSMNLTNQQKQSIQQSLMSEPAQSQPNGFTAQLGKKVPSSVKLNKVPSQLAQKVPSVKNDDYAKFRNNEIVIVNPNNREIMAVIGQSSTTGAAASTTMPNSATGRVSNTRMPNRQK